MAVAIDRLGAWLGQHNLRAVSSGYDGLHCWASGLGEIVTFGIEGTGSYGAGLARFLAARGCTIFEVNRPDRSTRRRVGKSDPVDAEMAARSVLAGVARDYPKSGLDTVEMIRMLKCRPSAIMGQQMSLSHRPVGELTNPGVGTMGLKRGRPAQFHRPLVGPQKGRLPLLVPWGLGPAPRGLATAP